MAKFRKKPVVVEAWQFRPYEQHEPDWLTEALESGGIWYQGGDHPYITIKTLEGEMRANHGDWIIRGVMGELYPCKPDIFAVIYDPVEPER